MKIIIVEPANSMNGIKKGIYGLLLASLLQVSTLAYVELNPKSAVLTCIDLHLLEKTLAYPVCEKTELHYGMCFAKDMPEAIKTMRSPEFRKQYDTVVRQASVYLDTVEPGPKKAVLTDLDETLMDTTGYYAKYPKWAPDTWFKWLKSKDSKVYNASLLALLKKAKAKGLAVMFVTGRPAFQAEATWHGVSFFNFTGGFLKPFEEQGYRPSSTVYKTQVRRSLEAMGYEIVLNIGDQESDLDLPVEPEKGEFLLPNVMYKLY